MSIVALALQVLHEVRFLSEIHTAGSAIKGFLAGVHPQVVEEIVPFSENLPAPVLIADLDQIHSVGFMVFYFVNHEVLGRGSESIKVLDIEG